VLITYPTGLLVIRRMAVMICWVAARVNCASTTTTSVSRTMMSEFELTARLKGPVRMAANTPESTCTMSRSCDLGPVSAGLPSVLAQAAAKTMTIAAAMKPGHHARHLPSPF
jgi:uncharacterized protein YhdP